MQLLLLLLLLQLLLLFFLRFLRRLLLARLDVRLVLCSVRLLLLEALRALRPLPRILRRLTARIVEFALIVSLLPVVCRLIRGTRRGLLAPTRLLERVLALLFLERRGLWQSGRGPGAGIGADAAALALRLVKTDDRDHAA